MDALLTRTALTDVGGAVVRMKTKTHFSESGYWEPGQHLSAEEVKRIPVENRRALVAAGRLQLYPSVAGIKACDREVFVVHRGSGKYDVIEGVKINTEPLTKEEAGALAAPLPQSAAA